MIAGLVVAEALAPSRRLRVAVSELGDAVVLDNGSGAYSAVAGDWGLRPIRWSDVLARALVSGASLQFITGNSLATRQFTRMLQRTASDLGREAALQIVARPQADVAGIAGDGFAVVGAMRVAGGRFLPAGETVVLETDPRRVTSFHQQFAQAWGESE